MDTSQGWQRTTLSWCLHWKGSAHRFGRELHCHDVCIGRVLLTGLAENYTVMVSALEGFCSQGWQRTTLSWCLHWKGSAHRVGRELHCHGVCIGRVLLTGLAENYTVMVFALEGFCSQGWQRTTLSWCLHWKGSAHRVGRELHCHGVCIGRVLLTGLAENYTVMVSALEGFCSQGWQRTTLSWCLHWKGSAHRVGRELHCHGVCIGRVLLTGLAENYTVMVSALEGFCSQGWQRTTLSWCLHWKGSAHRVGRELHCHGVCIGRVLLTGLAENYTVMVFALEGFCSQGWQRTTLSWCLHWKGSAHRVGRELHCHGVCIGRVLLTGLAENYTVMVSALEGFCSQGWQRTTLSWCLHWKGSAHRVGRELHCHGVCIGRVLLTGLAENYTVMVSALEGFCSQGWQRTTLSWCLHWKGSAHRVGRELHCHGVCIGRVLLTGLAENYTVMVSALEGFCSQGWQRTTLSWCLHWKGSAHRVGRELHCHDVCIGRVLLTGLAENYTVMVSALEGFCSQVWQRTTLSWCLHWKGSAHRVGRELHCHGVCIGRVLLTGLAENYTVMVSALEGFCSQGWQRTTLSWCLHWKGSAHRFGRELHCHGVCIGRVLLTGLAENYTVMVSACLHWKGSAHRVGRELHCHGVCTGRVLLTGLAENYTVMSALEGFCSQGWQRTTLSCLHWKGSAHRVGRELHCHVCIGRVLLTGLAENYTVMMSALEGFCSQGWQRTTLSWCLHWKGSAHRVGRELHCHGVCIGRVLLTGLAENYTVVSALEGFCSQGWQRTSLSCLHWKGSAHRVGRELHWKGSAWKHGPTEHSATVNKTLLTGVINLHAPVCLRACVCACMHPQDVFASCMWLYECV